MTATKSLGIWMDHSNAQLTELAANEATTVTSPLTHQVKENTPGNSEHLMHNKEQHQQADYYKKLGETILNYTDVLLFGPTEAKQELFNLLRKDHRFEKIRIQVKPADKMSEGQQHAFVKEYFSKR